MTVSPELAGRVAEVLTEEGQTVTAGQPLIRLDGATLEEIGEATGRTRQWVHALVESFRHTTGFRHETHT